MTKLRKLWNDINLPINEAPLYAAAVVCCIPGLVLVSLMIFVVAVTT